jgi:hypothetical protein
VQAAPVPGLRPAARWRGVLIEGDAEVYARLAPNRPEALCLHAAVCGSFQTVRWLPSTGQDGGRQRSGSAWEHLSEAQQAAQGGDVAAERLPSVTCTPLQYILDK